MMSTFCKSEPNFELFIKEFRRLFGSAANLDAFNWKGLFKHWQSLEFDDCGSRIDGVLNATVEDLIFKKYPLKTSFQRGFLKRFIEEAEQNSEPHDRLYELIVGLLSTDDSDSTAHFKHYFVKGRRFIVKESVSIISGGTTGLCSWQAGIYLANWVLSRPRIVSGKHVLELGCGVGLTGLALIFSENPPASFVFTDVHPSVLDALRENLSINSKNPDGLVSNICKTNVQVEILDWGHASDVKSILKEIPQVILAADVVYCLDLIPVLCDALKWLLNCYRDSIAVIACTIRNPETLNSFLKRLHGVGLEIIEECNAPVESRELYCPDDSPVRIFIISTSRS